MPPRPTAAIAVPLDYVPLDRANFSRPFAWHVEQHARVRPEHPAVLAGAETLTYGALNAAANRLAHYLLNDERARGAPVALLLPQGKAALIAIVACLKAGVPYAAIDPSLPGASVRALLESTGARLLLCDAAHWDAARAAAGDECHVSCVTCQVETGSDAWQMADGTQPATDEQGRTEHATRNTQASTEYGNPTQPITLHTLAAITYTSGTTGLPKGIVHTHGSIAQGAYRAADYLALAPSDRIGWLRSPAVLAVIEVFGALAAGATICALEPRTLPMRALAQAHLDARLTITTMAATVYRQLAGALAPGEIFPHLRWLSTGGETLYRGDVELYRRVTAPGCLFVTSWGATEAGGAMVRCTYDHTTPLPEERLVAGYPYPGVELLILDAEHRPLPTGETGEIAVRSAWMPEGYWRMPELTRVIYMAAPGRTDTTTDDGRRTTGDGRRSDDGPRRTEHATRNTDDDARIFLSGDLGRLRPDGCLEFLGRKDAQLKFRGFRVEPAEIEEALRAVPGIAQAAVVLRQDGVTNEFVTTRGAQGVTNSFVSAVREEARLVAYLVASAKPPPTVDVVRAAIAARLPSHMVPAAFVFMQSLPTASGGKIDRSRLPAPGRTRPALAVPYAPPRTPVEERLTRIWCELFGLDAVGLYDAFLDLGGHSLLAGRIIARVLAEFRVDLPLRALFDAPTVYEMALLITERQAQQLSPARLEQVLRDLEGQTVEVSI